MDSALEPNLEPRTQQLHKASMQVALGNTDAYGCLKIPKNLP